MADPEKNVPTPFQPEIREFSTLDRTVKVPSTKQEREPSLYSLVRAWFHSGHSLKNDRDSAQPSQSVTLPPSQPLVKEELKYPPQCFAIYYTNDSDVEQKLANVYKSAWVTAHTHYCNHKVQQRKRHTARHMVLLATAQQAQRSISVKKHPATPPQPHRSGTSRTPITPPPLHPSPPVQPGVTRPSPVSLSVCAQPPQKIQKQGSLEHGHYRVAMPHANTPQPLDPPRSASQQLDKAYQVPKSPGSIPLGFSAGSYSRSDALRQAHNLAERRVLAPKTSQEPPLQGNVKPECHMVAAPVNLADMQLRAARQLNMSAGMETATNHPAVRMDPFSMQPAHCEAQNTKRDVTRVHEVPAMAHSAGVSVSWEGFHSDNTDLQRQLQQLSEKESPVLPSARTLADQGEKSMGGSWDKSINCGQGGGVNDQAVSVHGKGEISMSNAAASCTRFNDGLANDAGDVIKEESVPMHQVISAPEVSVPGQHSSVYGVSG